MKIPAPLILLVLTLGGCTTTQMHVKVSSNTPAIANWMGETFVIPAIEARKCTGSTSARNNFKAEKKDKRISYSYEMRCQ